jgi:purine-binding chemotaxis protein CheW
MVDLYEDDELLNIDSEPYFLFKCAGDIYAFEALDVIEIIEPQQLTKVPKLQGFVKGVSNIRGTLVSVIDLLERFELGKTQMGKKTSIVLVKSIQEDEEHVMGVLIDEIFEVDGLDKDSISDTPLFGTKVQNRFIKNIAKYNNKEVCVLDQNEVLKIDDLAQIVEVSDD